MTLREMEAYNALHLRAMKACERVQANKAMALYFRWFAWFSRQPRFWYSKNSAKSLSGFRHGKG